MEIISNGRRVKVSFKRCSVSDKMRFHKSTCIIPISVVVQTHEGKKFLETMKLVDSSFKSCVLLIDDSIQKYTFKIDEPDKSLSFLHNKAIESGKRWLIRNKESYAKLTIPFKIMHWDDWLDHNSFEDSYADIEELYKTDLEYKHAMHASIDDFLCRYLSRSTVHNFDKNHAVNCCLQYLKEECTVMCLWGLEGFHYEIYPSGRNKAMVATYEKLIKSKNSNLLKSISLYFEKKSVTYMGDSTYR